MSRRTPASEGRKTRNARHVGLARALSKLGYCSRSHAFALIREGRVTLNGNVRRDPETPVNMDRDRVEVDGSPMAATAKVYLIMNKPRGLVTTSSDEKGRETVYSCLPPNLPWVAPVGRLDKASEGLLLMTNDSEWAARITDSASHLDKTYHVQVARVADETLARQLESAVHTEVGVLRAKRTLVLRHGQKNSWIEIVLDEGRNRQIRRMFAALEIEVLRLVRVAIGPLRLGDLPKGSCRPLTAFEKRCLDDAIEKSVDRLY